MHCKLEKMVDPMSISIPITLSSDELCSVDIAPFITQYLCALMYTDVFIYVYNCDQCYK